MRHKIFISVFIAFLILSSGCVKDETPTSPSDSTENPPFGISFAIEKQPTFSFGRDYIYYVSTDTGNSLNSGIYRTKVSNPVREKLFSGQSYDSPAVSPGGDRIALLKAGEIHYYDIAADSLYFSNLSGSYSSIKYLNDTLIVAERAKQLRLINILTDSSFTISAGFDPTFYKQDTVVFLKKIGLAGYSINKLTLSPIVVDKLSGPSVVEIPFDTIGSTENVRWASVDPQMNRYTYMVTGEDLNTVYSASTDGFESYEIIQTAGLKPLMINFNKIIYRGPDGRFYESDFIGSHSYPFWGEEGIIVE